MRGMENVFIDDDKKTTTLSGKLKSPNLSPAMRLEVMIKIRMAQNSGKEKISLFVCNRTSKHLAGLGF